MEEMLEQCCNAAIEKFDSVMTMEERWKRIYARREERLAQGLPEFVH